MQGVIENRVLCMKQNCLNVCFMKRNEGLSVFPRKGSN